MEEMLTRQQLEDVIQFAQGLASAQNIFTGERQGFYSPFLQNQQLQSLNNNPLIPTSVEKIQKALADYKNNSEVLQGYTEFMQKWDMVFARVLRSYSDILAFDLQIVPRGNYTPQQLQSKEYEVDRQRVFKFLDGFDYKSEFHKLCIEVMRHETVFAWFRKTKWGNNGMKGTIQILPQKYCMLTGYWEKGLLFDFDMSFFLSGNVDINGFDPVFKKYYKEMFIDNDYQNYYPTSALDDRNGTFALWHQTSPADGAYCVKFDLSNFNSTPFLAPFIMNCFTNAEIASLQKDKDIISAYAILAGEIRLFDEAKSGTVKDQFALAPKTLGKFMGMVKNGLAKNIKAVAMPTENTDFYQYNDSNKGMYNDHLTSTVGVGSGLSRLIYSSDRMSNAEVQYAVETQYHLMKPLYAQFENFLNYYVNKITKKFKFSFILDGCSYDFDKEKRIDRLMKLSDKGIILDPSAYAFAVDMRPQDFERSLMSAQSSKWYAKLGLFPNTNTASAGISGAGRPEMEDDLISESTEKNRNQ